MGSAKMGDGLSKLFIDPSHLPEDAYGFIQVCFLFCCYGCVLCYGAKLISDGSELLQLVPALKGIVGSVVLPVLGAVPDGALVLSLEWVLMRRNNSQSG